jgi:hypothetical protein
MGKGQIAAVPVLSETSATGTGSGAGAVFPTWNEKVVFQILGTITSNTGTCIVQAQGSLDGTNWTTLASMSVACVTGSTITEAAAINAPYPWTRMYATRIDSGCTIVGYKAERPF